MRLTITRGPTSDQGTPGIATLDNGLSWHSLELPWRDNAPQVSCIPPGSYTASPFSSPHFHMWIYKLAGVPGRDDVEIHMGNWAGDVTKGYHSDVLGCVVLGKAIGVLPPYGKASQLAVLQSTTALQEFLSAVAGQPIEVVVQWQAGCAP